MVLTGLHVQPHLAVGDVSARQALILLVTKNQMLRLTTPNARTRQSPLGKTRRRGRLTTVGLRPPFVSQPRRHSHPDCRSLLTLIVAQHGTFKANYYGIQYLYRYTVSRDWALFAKKRSVCRDRSGCPARLPTPRSAGCLAA